MRRTARSNPYDKSVHDAFLAKTMVLSFLWVPVYNLSVLSPPIDWVLLGRPSWITPRARKQAHASLGGSMRLFLFCRSMSHGYYRRMVYKLDVLLPFSRYLGCLWIQPVRSNSFNARRTVERDSPRSEAIVLTPGQQEPESAERSFR